MIVKKIIILIYLLILSLPFLAQNENDRAFANIKARVINAITSSKEVGEG